MLIWLTIEYQCYRKLVFSCFAPKHHTSILRSQLLVCSSCLDPLSQTVLRRVITRCETVFVYNSKVNVDKTYFRYKVWSVRHSTWQHVSCSKPSVWRCWSFAPWQSTSWPHLILSAAALRSAWRGVRHTWALRHRVSYHQPTIPCTLYLHFYDKPFLIIESK